MTNDYGVALQPHSGHVDAKYSKPPRLSASSVVIPSSHPAVNARPFAALPQPIGRPLSGPRRRGRGPTLRGPLDGLDKPS
jgi:hypothetical protein